MIVEFSKKSKYQRDMAHPADKADEFVLGLHTLGHYNSASISRKKLVAFRDALTKLIASKKEAEYTVENKSSMAVVIEGIEK